MLQLPPSGCSTCGPAMHEGAPVVKPFVARPWRPLFSLSRFSRILLLRVSGRDLPCPWPRMRKVHVGHPLIQALRRIDRFFCPSSLTGVFGGAAEGIRRHEVTVGFIPKRMAEWGARCFSGVNEFACGGGKQKACTAEAAASSRGLQNGLTCCTTNAIERCPTAQIPYRRTFEAEWGLVSGVRVDR